MAAAKDKKRPDRTKMVDWIMSVPTNTLADVRGICQWGYSLKLGIEKQFDMCISVLDWMVRI